MKVSAFKNIDVEVEVDVSLDDVLNELHEDAAADGIPRIKLSHINSTTRIMETIGVGVLDQASDKRLAAELLWSRLSPFVEWCRANGVETKGGA